MPQLDRSPFDRITVRAHYGICLILSFFGSLILSFFGSLILSFFGSLILSLSKDEAGIPAMVHGSTRSP